MKKLPSGFTLIELLVVIAIIALLTGIIMTNLSSSRGKARDAKRISDIGQMQLAVELFFDRCKLFPLADTGTNTLLDPNTNTCTVSGTTVKLADYLSKIPLAPAGTTYNYFVNTNRSDYFLHVTLEKTNEAVRDGMDAAPSWYTGSTFPPDNKVCDDDAGAVQYCLSSK